MKNKLPTVKEFKKQHAELKGKKIILCEHLKSKSVDAVSYNFYAGDNTRFLLCTICRKVLLGDTQDYMLRTVLSLVEITKGTKHAEDYKQWIETGGTDAISK